MSVSRRVITAAGAVALAASVLSGSATTAVAEHDTNLNPDDFRLTASGYNGVIDDLDGLLPVESVSQVVDSSNRDASSCSPNVTHRVAAFCWNSGDNGTSAWYPQGTTTSYDATGEDTYQGETLVLNTWYDHNSGGPKGVRVSFVDVSDPSAPRYRHVLLVEPYTNDGQPDFRAIAGVHAGGLFWYGPYLYVVDTRNGFRVFDTRHIWRASTGDKAKIGRQPDGTYHAHNYRYALPQAFRYTSSTAGGENSVRFSFTGLDRTSGQDSAIVGEYEPDGAGTRLIRYPLDATDHTFAESDDDVVYSTEAHLVEIARMQGAVAIDDTFYLIRSNGSGGRADLGVWTPGNFVDFHNGMAPPGPEDLSYWGSRNQLWSNAEYPGNRSVYAFRPTDFG